jgi:FAD/FMN-containing dehydrogenase
MAPGAWTNWPGNVSADPAEIIHPRDEPEVCEIVAGASARGQGVRVVGAGHSFMPLCATDGILLCLDRMAGLVRADPGRHRAVVRPGSTIGSLGDPLWAAGLCLHNQGDIDTQHITGAISTATHGSGLALPSFSATARAFRVVQPDGEVAVVGEDRPDMLAALQTSLGLLGVITEVELDVRPAFTLCEQIDFWPLAEILERWDDEMAARRHFSFFYLPYSDSAETLFLESPGGMDLADHGFVKRYDERDAGTPPGEGADLPPGAFRRRTDRPYRIYPDPPFEGEIVHRELEYMVPSERGQDAFLALRSLIRSRRPRNRFPVEIRAVAADEAMLSPFYRRDSVSVSICGHRDDDYHGFLTEVHQVLEPFEPRPHWGKLHYFDGPALSRRLPRFHDFRALRDRTDPAGIFLNANLAGLLR